MTALLCVAVLVASCGSGGDDSPEGDPGQPRHGGSITVQQPFEPGRGLNFLVSDDPSLMQILSGTVYSKLVDLRTGEGVTKVEIVPDLATEWTVSEDGLTYTFDLRDDVTWQNVPPVSGRPFTADDVVATFEGLKASQSTHKWMAEPIESIKAEGDHRVVFELSHPYAPFLEYMAHHFNVILPREGVDGEFDMATKAIGTGPFMVDSHKPDVEWVLKRNPDYYEDGKPYLDEIRLPIISDSAAVTAALRSGRLDIGAQPFDVIENTFRDNNDFTVTERAADFVSFDINTTRAPFTDPRVRRAIMMAIDWENMGENTRGKMNYTSLLRPEISDAALTGEQVRELRPYDPERARQLLAEAGYPNGFQTTLLVQKLSDADIREGEWIVADLAEVGIDAEISTLDPATAIWRRRDHQFDLSKAARAVIFPDQTIQDYRSGSAENYAAISDPQVDQMIAESRTTLDDEDRNQIYRDFQEHMETEVAGSVLPVQYYQFWAVNNRVQNYYQSPIYHGRRYADMWVTGD
ncbi:ABC transporter substrate-binding protein [Saccharomonospora sp. NPDC046836]|uniref:ABC transporter substrate-binding protein n=1 Tax=Saccharomonospora sp. NPDC046836 TaxID=3156921 RepID=UPI0033FBC888